MDKSKKQNNVLENDLKETEIDLFPPMNSSVHYLCNIRIYDKYLWAHCTGGENKALKDYN